MNGRRVKGCDNLSHPRNDRRNFKAGDVVELGPGESITLTPYLYHEFWGTGGRVLVGEVSLVNDDAGDNRFYKPVGRFPSNPCTF